MALGTYNRTMANRIGGAMAYPVKGDFYGTMNMSAQSGVRYHCIFQGAGEMQAYARLWWGYGEMYDMAGSMQMTESHYVVLSPVYNFAGSMDAIANQELPILCRAEESVECDVSARIVITPAWGTLAGAMTANLNSLQVKEIVMTFENLKIPAGSSLVIDSENYVVLLNGENVIDQYEGDWFWFARRLQGMEVVSKTSAKPQVSILYRERYL